MLEINHIFCIWDDKYQPHHPCISNESDMVLGGYKSYLWAGKMAKLVKVFDTKPDNPSQSLGPTSCPLTFTYMLRHAQVYTHTQNINE